MINGTNGIIVSLGAKESGKTYSIMGNESTKGLLKMSISALLKQLKSIKENQFSIKLR